MLAPQEEVVPAPIVEAPMTGAVIAGAMLAPEDLDSRAEIAPAVEIIEEEAPGPVAEAAFEEEAPPAEMVAEVPAAEVAAEILKPQEAEIPPQQEEVSALQAQLAALQAQLDELGETEDLPAVVEDEGPAPGAAEELKLPGADEAARVAAEMAALEIRPEPGVS